MSARIPVNFPDYISGFRSRVINGILDYLRALEPEDSADIKWTRTPSGFSGRILRDGADNHPNPTEWDFWAWQSGKAAITINAGEVQFGAHAAVAAAQTELTVNNDGDLLGLRYTIATHALEIVNFGTSITVNTTTFQRWLVIASLVGGVAGISRYGYFNPWINAYYAGATP